MEPFANKILLASASPRRREILADMGFEFEVRPADIDEAEVRIKRAAALVKELSKRKAAAVEAEGYTVIAADTVVARKGKIYGKPHTEDRAKRTLLELQGKWHSVYTGVTVACGGRSVSFVVRSRVKFHRLSQTEIEEYVNAYKPLDKAGAYGIQDSKVVEKYRGSYSNIVGLPRERLAAVLARAGVSNGDNRTFN